MQFSNVEGVLHREDLGDSLHDYRGLDYEAILSKGNGKNHLPLSFIGCLDYHIGLFVTILGSPVGLQSSFCNQLQWF